MLMTPASLDALNARLTRKVSFKTFRPTIVISGCEAFAEVFHLTPLVGN
jgi:uncharacterized protein YcbX